MAAGLEAVFLKASRPVSRPSSAGALSTGCARCPLSSSTHLSLSCRAVGGHYCAWSASEKRLPAVGALGGGEVPAEHPVSKSLA